MGLPWGTVASPRARCPRWMALAGAVTFEDRGVDLDPARRQIFHDARDDAGGVEAALDGAARGCPLHREGEDIAHGDAVSIHLELGDAEDAVAPVAQAGDLDHQVE